LHDRQRGEQVGLVGIGGDDERRADRWLAEGVLGLDLILGVVVADEQIHAWQEVGFLKQLLRTDDFDVCLLLVVECRRSAEVERPLVGARRPVETGGLELVMKTTRAKEVLKNIVKEIQSDVSVDFIQKTVADYFKVDIELLKAKVKKREIVIPRQLAMYFCKRYTQLTLALIGENFGGRDHSTVIHALESVEDMMKTDANFKNSVEELSKKLKLRMAS